MGDDKEKNLLLAGGAGTSSSSRGDEEMGPCTVIENPIYNPSEGMGVEMSNIAENESPRRPSLYGIPVDDGIIVFASGHESEDGQKMKGGESARVTKPNLIPNVIPNPNPNPNPDPDPDPTLTLPSTHICDW